MVSAEDRVVLEGGSGALHPEAIANVAARTKLRGAGLKKSRDEKFMVVSRT